MSALFSAQNNKAKGNRQGCREAGGAKGCAPTPGRGWGSEKAGKRERRGCSEEAAEPGLGCGEYLGHQEPAGLTTGRPVFAALLFLQPSQTGTLTPIQPEAPYSTPTSAPVSRDQNPKPKLIAWFLSLLAFSLGLK